jgi:hypothetical protein
VEVMHFKAIFGAVAFADDAAVAVDLKALKALCLPHG